jgi:zinc/manganese transport system permease protein
METISFLLYPFLACVLLIAIHAYFGVHIIERGIIFVDLALAQFIGIGLAFAFVFGEENRTLFSVLFAILGSAVLAFSKKISRHVNVEAFIGVLYIFSFSASILILDHSPHGVEEFKAIMNGNIIWVTPNSLVSTAVVYGIVGVLHLILRRQFIALTSEGKGGVVMEFLFFASFAAVLVKSVQMAGILQVFSFLVIPALIGRLFFQNRLKILITGWVAGTLVCVTGIALSYKFDLPTAPSIVVGLAGTFFALLAVKTALDKPWDRA